MNSDLTRLLQANNSNTSAPADLNQKILAKIEVVRAQQVRKQKILWSTTSIVFLGCTIATGYDLYGKIISSETGSYLSLAFSDASLISSAWKEFTYSLIESLPAITLGLFLMSMYFVFWSARKYPSQIARFA